MPLQNRVDPFGELFAAKARGLFMGNRGGRIHSPQKTLGARRWASKQWICCVLDFNNRHRNVWGDSYTELFFLDEPTAGLDPISATQFDDLVNDLQKTLDLTVVMVTHDIDTLRATTDRIAVLVDRKMKIGTIETLMRDPHPWIQEYFAGARGRAALTA